MDHNVNNSVPQRMQVITATRMWGGAAPPQTRVFVIHTSISSPLN
ncbi:hypothetical protein RMSM_02016 [Rhodopirellula maiorica SM1]|uniref:Uncharacterized protein n=1 Tax=Rhodopirellula maiorica SM1 TaxID=1265738 RepID=M5S4C5_9BACT|nr:hypothetical protein RMSM_02016 [Rhodopirellula maiorica SM1]